MIWGIEFLQEAEKDMKRLDHSVQIQVLKGIKKVSKNPLPVSQGGHVTKLERLIIVIKKILILLT